MPFDKEDASGIVYVWVGSQSDPEEARIAEEIAKEMYDSVRNLQTCCLINHFQYFTTIVIRPFFHEYGAIVFRIYIILQIILAKLVAVMQLIFFLELAGILFVKWLDSFGFDFQTRNVCFYLVFLLDV